MHFTPAIAAAVLAGTASAKVHQAAPTTTAAVISSSAAPNATWITQTVTEFITDCPTPTSFVHNKKTYTVTSSTQVTVPCPTTCTISWNPAKPSVIPVGVVPPKQNGTAPYWNNGTAPVAPGPKNGTGVPVPVPTTACPTCPKGSNVPAGNNPAGNNPAATKGSSSSGSNSPAGTKTPATASSGNVKTVSTAAILAGLVGVATFAL